MLYLISVFTGLFSTAFTPFSLSILVFLYLFFSQLSIKVILSKEFLLFVTFLFFLLFFRVVYLYIFDGLIIEYLLLVSHIATLVAIFLSLVNQKADTYLKITTLYQVIVFIAISLFIIIVLQDSNYYDLRLLYRIASPSDYITAGNTLHIPSDSHVFSVQIALIGLISIVTLTNTKKLLSILIACLTITFLVLIGSRSGMLLFILGFIIYITTIPNTWKLRWIKPQHFVTGIIILITLFSLALISESRSFAIMTPSTYDRIFNLGLWFATFHNWSDVIFGLSAQYNKFNDLMVLNIFRAGGLFLFIGYLFISLKIIKEGLFLTVLWVLMMFFSEFIMLPRVLVLFMLLIIAIRREVYVNN